MSWTDQITIVSNYQPRDVIDYRELEPKERDEFDYIDWDELSYNGYSHDFVRYKGQLYDLEEFQRPHIWAPVWNYWDGYMSEGFFSGLLVKFVDSSLESVIMGRYYS